MCDVIIIECSGLSNPLDVLSALSAPALLREIAVSHLVCLLDSPRIEKVLKVVELARVQAASADVLILNKLDRLDPTHREATHAFIDGVNVPATRHWASYGDIGEAALDALLAPLPPARCRSGEQYDHAHDHQHAHAHALPSSFCTAAFPLPDMVARPALEALLHTLPAQVIRAKGFALLAEEGWHTFHRVYDAADITPLFGTVPSIGAVLVCIGQHLEADSLRTMVEQAFPLAAQRK